MIGLMLGLAAAVTPDLELTWVAPEGCPDQAELELRVADLVGRPVTVGPDAAWSVRARVERASDRWKAQVRLRTKDGEQARAFAAEACDALADAVAVIVALALGDAPPGPEAPPTRSATVASASPRPRVVRPRPRPRAPPPAAPWLLSVEAEARTHLGLPDPGLGAALMLGARRAGWSLALGCGGLRSGADRPSPGQAVRVEVLAAQLRGCGPGLRGRPWFLDLCLGGALGRARVVAEGRARGAQAVGWAEAGPELGLGFEGQGPWAAALWLRLRFALARPEAVVALADGVTRAFRVPPITGGLGLSIRGDFFLTD